MSLSHVRSLFLCFSLIALSWIGDGKLCSGAGEKEGNGTVAVFTEQMVKKAMLHCEVDGCRVTVKINGWPVLWRRNFSCDNTIGHWIKNGENVLTTEASLIKGRFDGFYNAVVYLKSEKTGELVKDLPTELSDEIAADKAGKIWKFNATMPEKWNWEKGAPIENITTEDRLKIRGVCQELFDALKGKDVEHVLEMRDLTLVDAARLGNIPKKGIVEQNRKFYKETLSKSIGINLASFDKDVDLIANGYGVSVMPKKNAPDDWIIQIKLSEQTERHPASSWNIESVMLAKIDGVWRMVDW
ncbi:MAG: hypothetical protein V1809_01600 [Planctomycetota bacterium]